MTPICFVAVSLTQVAVFAEHLQIAFIKLTFPVL